MLLWSAWRVISISSALIHELKHSGRQTCDTFAVSCNFHISVAWNAALTLSDMAHHAFQAINMQMWGHWESYNMLNTLS